MIGPGERGLGDGTRVVATDVGGRLKREVQQPAPLGQSLPEGEHPQPGRRQGDGARSLGAVVPTEPVDGLPVCREALGRE